jgi:hypothetical protein
VILLQGGAGGQSSWALEAVNYEGWRVAVDEGEGRHGWVLLRQSLHDPLLVLNVESDVQGGEWERVACGREGDREGGRETGRACMTHCWC